MRDLNLNTKWILFIKMNNIDKNTPWVEKYRPQYLDDVVHHAEVIQLLRTFISTQEIPHLFFYGPPGTGKTSTILSCANEIYGKHSSTMVMHLNASDERGIDVVRKQIIQFSSTDMMFHKNSQLKKLIILDEADSMDSNAQQALLDIMVSYEILFCFIGNYQYTFIPQLQSRLIKLLFTPIPEEDAIELGKTILQKEQFDSSGVDIPTIYKASNGDMRQFLNLLQVITMKTRQEKKTNDLCSMNDIIHSSKFTNVYDFIENTIKHKTIQDCYAYLHKSITQTHQATLSLWVSNIFDYVLNYIQKHETEYANKINKIHSFLQEMARIEQMIDDTLHSDIQLFALVSCVHQFYCG